MKNVKGTVLFVTSRLPFPTTSGRKTSLYHYCRILSEEMGYRLIVASSLESGDNPEKKPDFIHRLVILPKATVVRKIIYILRDSIIRKKKPMQVSLYWSTKAQKIIRQLTEEEKPDIVIGDMVRSTEYIKDLNTYRISDLDDLISLRYRRQLNEDFGQLNPYGAFFYTMPKFFRKIMSINMVKKYIIENEINLLQKYELDIGRICEKTVFVAKNEAELFNKELGEMKATAVPIGVDTEFFKYDYKCVEHNYIGFLGAMNVAHNENAVRHFIDNIFPYILEKTPDARFVIIGGGVSKELMRLSSDNIVFTERVDDVREYLRMCEVFVCPMTFGSGIKTKNLEVMSMGIPVVTTSVGAENIDAENVRDWIVTDDNREFADTVIELLSDENKRIEMGKNASDFVRRNFTWDRAKRSFEMIFEEIQ